jgi:hypothetical protein
VKKYVCTIGKDSPIESFPRDVVHRTCRELFSKKITFNELVEHSNRVVSCAASTEGTQYLMFEKDSPQITVKGVLGQTFTGPCPAPYFLYASVDDTKLVGNLTPLPEPLKVRNITTISAMEFSSGKPLQVALADRMKNHPSLLFGREVTGVDLEELRLRSISFWSQFPICKNEKLLWISGDYENATDNVHPDFSRLTEESLFDLNMIEDFPLVPMDQVKPLWNIMAKIYSFLPVNGPNDQKKNWLNVNIYISLFAQKECTFRSKRERLWKRRRISYKSQYLVTQNFGQMMGDIKSFPILCIMNLSLWRGCVEKYLKINNFRYPPCLINGDDFCAYAPEPLIQIWFEMARDYNFIPSIGKSYVSDKVTINSRLFTQGDGEMKKVDLIPINILFKTPHDVPVSDSVNLLIENRPLLFNRWINYNRDTVKSITRGGIINLNLPLSLGGVGIKHKPKLVSAKQGALARKNLYAIKNGYPELISRPLWETKPISRIKCNDKLYLDFLRKHEHLGGYKTDCRGIAKDAWLSTLSREFSGAVYMRLRIPFIQEINHIKGKEFLWGPEVESYYDYKPKHIDIKYKHVLQLSETCC